MYFSLQYLSLSDAVVLKFLAPILTGFSGAVFLKESLSLKDIIAGREYFMIEVALNGIYVVLVCSFSGVILIARPQVIFGGSQENPSEVVTSGQRMVSVTLGNLCSSCGCCAHLVS